MNRGKVLFSICVFSLFIICTGIFKISFGKEDGAPSGNTGSPGDGKDCAHSDCHTGSSVPRDGLITTNVPPSGYFSDSTYIVTVTIDEPGVVKFGFQASPQNLAGDAMGSVSVINATDTKTTGAGKYITHTKTGTGGTDSRVWTFNWTPEDASGDVTFYTAVNASNDNGHATGDKIYTNSITVIENPANIPLTVEELNKIYFDINNPVTNSIQIEMATAVNTPVQITLSDANGNLIREIDPQMSNGTFEIPVNDLAHGIYFLSARNNRDLLTKKVVIL